MKLDSTHQSAYDHKVNYLKKYFKNIYYPDVIRKKSQGLGTFGSDVAYDIHIPSIPPVIDTGDSKRIGRYFHGSSSFGYPPFLNSLNQQYEYLVYTIAAGPRMTSDPLINETLTYLANLKMNNTVRTKGPYINSSTKAESVPYIYLHLRTNKAYYVKITTSSRPRSTFVTGSYSAYMYLYPLNTYNIIKPPEPIKGKLEINKDIYKLTSKYIPVGANFKTEGSGRTIYYK